MDCSFDFDLPMLEVNNLIGYFCRRQGHEYLQSFRNGVASAELSKSKLPKKDAKKTGTQIEFLYDKTIFEEGWAQSSDTGMTNID